MSTSRSTNWFGSGAAEEQYIRQTAASYGVDPEAALAVAAHEGITLPSEVGDQGTSFGPWQLHQGGALPQTVASQGAQYAETWANSAAGINYALEQIAKASAGQTGPTAVRDIVYNFENPADPAGETSAATQTYQAGGGPQTTNLSLSQLAGGALAGFTSNPAPSEGQQVVGAVTGPFNSALGGVESGISGIQSGISGIGTGISFITSWRFAEIVGGVLLLLVGLFIFAKSMGLNAGPNPAAVASRLTP